MRRIGLFCGSFNPIHIGHTSLAKEIIKSTDLDEIWFVVSPHNPLKQQAGLLDEQERLKMVDIALHGNPQMHSSDIEFRLPKPSYTINTLKYLNLTYPDYRFSLIIGSDNLRVFHLWREHDYILQNFNIIVYPRQGDNMRDLKGLYPSVNVVEAPLLPISSTEIRDMIRHNDISSAKKWLDPEVLRYIIEKAKFS